MVCNKAAQWCEGDAKKAVGIRRNALRDNSATNVGWEEYAKASNEVKGMAEKRKKGI